MIWRSHPLAQSMREALKVLVIADYIIGESKRGLSC